MGVAYWVGVAFHWFIVIEWQLYNLHNIRNTNGYGLLGGRGLSSVHRYWVTAVQIYDKAEYSPLSQHQWVWHIEWA